MIFWFVKGMIFLDNNATTPMAPEVINGILRTCQDAWANPSSSYKRGREAKSLITDARQSILQMVTNNSGDHDVNADDVITFTSGGTEANATVIHWATETFRNRFQSQIPHVITTNIEHCATELPLKR